MKILLVKLKHIGDTLIMTPTIHAIRKTYPHAKIDVVVRKGCEGVLEMNPDIDNIYTIARPEKEKRSVWESLQDNIRLFSATAFRRYDYAFDLSNSDRAKLIITLSLAKHRCINRWHAKLGWKERLFTDFSDFAWGKKHRVLQDFMTVRDVLDLEQEAGPLRLWTDDIDPTPLLQRFSLGDKPYIVIHPASRWSFKEWEPTRWRQIIKFLLSSNFEVLLSCGPDIKEISKIEKMAEGLPGVKFTRGQTTLRELGVLIKNASLFAGVDTVAMHIAAAVQTPVVALFGPSSEWSWAPWQVPQRLVLGNCPCKINQKFVCDKSRIFPCMDDIDYQEVVKAIEELIGKGA